VKPLGEPIEVSEIAKADGEGGTGKATVGIGAEADSIPTRDRRDVLDVIEAVLDRGVTIFAMEETAEEIEADHPVAGGDGLDLVVAKMAWIPTGDRGGVRVGRADRSVRSFQHVVERRLGEMREIVGDSTFIEGVDDRFTRRSEAAGNAVPPGVA